MVYSCSENEQVELKAKLDKTNALPLWLNDENIGAKDVKYKGDLKKRF